MREIYFGPVAKFCEAEDVMALGAAYRKSRQDTELEHSLNMLKQHLSGYFSSASPVPPDRVLAGNAMAENSTGFDSLDSFFQ